MVFLLTGDYIGGRKSFYGRNGEINRGTDWLQKREEATKGETNGVRKRCEFVKEKERGERSRKLVTRSDRYRYRESSLPISYDTITIENSPRSVVEEKKKEEEENKSVQKAEEDFFFVHVARYAAAMPSHVASKVVGSDRGVHAVEPATIISQTLGQRIEPFRMCRVARGVLSNLFQPSMFTLSLSDHRAISKEKEEEIRICHPTCDQGGFGCAQAKGRKASLKSKEKNPESGPERSRREEQVVVATPVVGALMHLCIHISVVSALETNGKKSSSSSFAESSTATRTRRRTMVPRHSSLCEKNEEERRPWSRRKGGKRGGGRKVAPE
ncbi:hypothetical protein WH47_06784 [Habropoda laboriosa]|uniref:Uncharacterized protein n=1 Tax=Habropoda laboriosa TaxID=597456 RepID=A0A0L7RIT5_9HYME|nr:hypothetical protein WH47_06784 [Habropoda laboriosa]